MSSESCWHAVSVRKQYDSQCEKRELTWEVDVLMERVCPAGRVGERMQEIGAYRRIAVSSLRKFQTPLITVNRLRTGYESGKSSNVLYKLPSVQYASTPCPAFG